MNDQPFTPPGKSGSARLAGLLALALVGSGAGNYWLWQERQRATADARSATGKLAAVEAAQKELAEKVQELQGESIAIASARPPAPADAGASVGGPSPPAKQEVAGGDAVEKANPAASKGAEPQAKAMKPDVDAASPEANAAPPDGETKATKPDARPDPEAKPTKPAPEAKTTRSSSSARRKTKAASKPKKKTAQAKSKKEAARPERQPADREL